MPTNKEIFISKMNALANSINTKAGTFGAKDLDGLKAAVDSIEPGGGGKAHTFQIPSVTGTYTYNGSSQTAAISGYYGDFMTKSGDLYATNAGSYSITFTLADTTNCQWSDNTTAPKIVTWSIAKAALPRPVLSKLGIVLRTGVASDTFTVSRSGDGAISAVSDNPSKITASVSGTTVTVSAPDTSAADSAAITVSVAESANYLAYTGSDLTVSAEIRVGFIEATVSGLGSASPSNVTFTKDPTFTAAGLNITEVTVGGDTFIRIPTMYRKINTVSNNQITSFTMANGPVDSSYSPYPVFLAEDGVTVLPYVLIGKYGTTSSTSMVSTGSAGWQSLTITDARTYARQKGAGYQLYDWQFMKLWQDLIIIITESVSIKSVTTDALGIFWMCTTGYGGSAVDGLWNNNGSFVFSYKPSKYTDDPTSNTDGYKSVPYTVPSSTGTSLIKKLGYSAADPFLNIPSATDFNPEYDTYYCCGYYYSPTSAAADNTMSLGPNHKQFGSYFLGLGDPKSYIKFQRLCYRPVTT